MSEFSFKLGELNEIVEEKGNTFKALRRISFNERPEQLDIRGWYMNGDGKEIMGKGVQLSDEGANNLTVFMVREKYGDTKEIITELKKREDFFPSLTSALSNEELEQVGVDISKVDSSEFYDPISDFDLNNEEEAI